MDKHDLKQLKQFRLHDKDSCIIYLQRIIYTIDLCLVKLKKYVKELEELYLKYKSENAEIVPYEVCSDMSDKISNVIAYLFNIIGDMEPSSMSYKKYRQQAKRLIEAGEEGIMLTPDEINRTLNEFNKYRNWHHHISDSILTSQLSSINRAHITYNPIMIFYYNYERFDILESLYIGSKDLYTKAQQVHQAAKKDYSLLIGESVEIQRVQNELKPTDVLDAINLSAKAQGLNTK